MKTILHLCADIGSDTQPYADNGYNVIKIGKNIGIENFIRPLDVYGIIANPPCTEFSIASGVRKKDCDFSLVDRCLQIINACKPKFWAIENPATGTLKSYLGEPVFTYEPWEFGSPWTKKTALWGNFNIPQKIYTKWEDVPKNNELYIRPGRGKPSLAFLHKSAIHKIDEFKKFNDFVKTDADFRSLCSQGFAKAFFEVNK